MMEHEHMNMQGHEKHEHREHDHSSMEDEEISDWKKKLIGSLIFAVPLLIIMFVTRILGIEIINETITIIIFLVLGFPVVFIFGFSTLRGGLRGLFTFYFNMDSLIALGTIVAYLTGIFALMNFVQDYSGVAGAIMAIFILGKYIEAKARGRATKEIKKLLELGAKKAKILRGKEEVEIDISEV